MDVLQCACGGQSTHCRSKFSPSTVPQGLNSVHQLWWQAPLLTEPQAVSFNGVWNGTIRQSS